MLKMFFGLSSCDIFFITNKSYFSLKKTYKRIYLTKSYLLNDQINVNCETHEFPLQNMKKMRKKKRFETQR